VRRETHRLALLIAGTLAVRLAAGAIAPLTIDEAYYRLWSMRPAFGYFDHPPMIAWQVWLGRRLVGDTPLGVRLIPCLSAALTTLATFDLARLAGLGEQIALRSAVWLNATILIGVGGLMAVPDAPATLFWTATLWAVFKARCAPAWWLAAGLFAGLACLSKYSALFLAPGLLLWLAASAEGRRTLATPWPWLAGAGAAAVFAPNVLWNADHHWLTFAKQFGRVGAMRLAPQHLPAFLLTQFALLNPLIAVFLVRAVRLRPAWPLLIISAPFALYLLIHSLHDAVQGQWPAPLYPSLVIAAAAAAENAPARIAAPILGFAVSVAALAFICAPLDGCLPIRDPAAFARGWPNFARDLERTRQAAGAGWIGTTTYGLAAQLADHREIRAPVAEVREPERHTFERPAADFARPGLILDQPRFINEDALRACFATLRRLPDIGRGQGTSRTPYALYLAAEPRRDMARDGC
jgi:4-amino-4-deoxy-L-arabinose transferase-like glycosyltransferase